jgi:hypothetical protein
MVWHASFVCQLRSREGRKWVGIEETAGECGFGLGKENNGRFHCSRSTSIGAAVTYPNGTYESGLAPGPTSRSFYSDRPQARASHLSGMDTPPQPLLPCLPTVAAPARWLTRSRTTPPRPLCRNSRAPRSRSRPGRAPAPRAHAAPGVFGLGHDSPRSGTRSTPAGSPSFSRSGTRSSAPAHAARPRGPPPRLVPAEAAHRGSGRFSQGQHGERDAAASGATVHLPSVRLRTPCDHVTSSSC